MSGELGSGESRGLRKVAQMWRTAGLAAASADHGKGCGARKKARQSVGDDAKKSKKWCVLVHFGARRTLNMHGIPLVAWALLTDLAVVESSAKEHER